MGTTGNTHSVAWLEAWIDGACAPINPGGTAGYGLVIKRRHETLLRQAVKVGSGKEMSSNVAEYSGLIGLLEWYKAQEISEHVTVYSDSRMLINQAWGTWRAKKGLYYPFYIEAMSLLNELGRGRFHFKWIPRENNTKADELSKQAIGDVVTR